MVETDKQVKKNEKLLIILQMLNIFWPERVTMNISRSSLDNSLAAEKIDVFKAKKRKQKKDKSGIRTWP